MPAAPAPLRFDMTPLKVGTMLRTPPGSRTTIPHLPDMTTDGYAWVVESGPDVLRIRERAKVWGHVPATFDQTFRLDDDGRVDFTVKATGFGMPVPPMHKAYELVDAGKGWLSLRSAGKPAEQPGQFAVRDGVLHVDLPGPFGSFDHKLEPVIQPGEAGYVQPPADWLPAAP